MQTRHQNLNNSRPELRIVLNADQFSEPHKMQGRNHKLKKLSAEIIKTPNADQPYGPH